MNRDALARDPLDAWAANERRLLDDGVDRAPRTDGAQPFLPSAGTALDIAHDYARAGLIGEAIAVLAGPFAPDRDPGALPDGPVHPRLAARAGRGCRRGRSSAGGTPGACQPTWSSRRGLEDIVVLRSAMAADPRDARAAHYLGNLLYDRRRYAGSHRRVADGRTPGPNARDHPSEPGHRRVRPIRQATPGAGSLRTRDASRSARCPAALRVRPAAEAGRHAPVRTARHAPGPPQPGRRSRRLCPWSW